MDVNKGSLTPQNPLCPEQVKNFLEALQLPVLSESGVRVFYDGLSPKARGRLPDAEIVENELRYSLLEPYRRLGRYYHLMARFSGHDQ